MAKVYSYIRMSTSEQLHGDSLRRQMDGTEAFAKQHGLVVDELLNDIGRSAFRGRNTEGDSALARFLNLIDSGRVERGSYLVVESLDRLSRESVDVSFDLLRSIISRGVSIATIEDQQVYRSDSFGSLVPLLIVLSKLVRGHDESKIKSERVAHAWRQKKIKAANHEVITKRIPAWLKWTPSGIEVIEERAAVVREIFVMLRDGWGAYSIARELNGRGLPAWSSRKRAVWRESYIKKMLYGRTVLGEYQPHRLMFDAGKTTRVPDGDAILGYYPAVVSPELYEEATAAAARRKISGRGRKGAGFSNLFTGLLYCGSCGAGMLHVNKGPAPKGGRYLHCSVANARGRRCVARPWRYELIETALLNSIDELDLSYVLDGRSKESVCADLKFNASRIDDQIEMHEKRIKRTSEAIRSSAIPIPTLVVHNEEDQRSLIELEKQKDEIEKRIREVESFDKEARRARLDSLLEKISGAEDSERQEVRRALSAELRRSLDKIIVRTTTRVAHEARSGGTGDWDQDLNLLEVNDSHSSDGAWAEQYKELSVTEFAALLQKLNFEFVFVYRSGREHHIDPVTRESLSLARSPRFSLLKEAIRLKTTGSVS